MGWVMSRINDYFIQRFETDPEFREEVELAELQLSEPDYSGGEGQEPEALESPDLAGRLAA